MTRHLDGELLITIYGPELRQADEIAARLLLASVGVGAQDPVAVRRVAVLRRAIAIGLARLASGEEKL